MTDVDAVAGGFLLVMGRLRRRLRQLPVESGGVTIPELTALARIDRSGPQTGSELAKAEQISPQSMGVTVTALEAKGLLARAADPADGRRVVWSLTDAGREMVADKRGARVHQVAAAMVTLDATEVEALRDALPVIDKIVANL